MIYNGDALSVLRTLPDASVNCCITSPPYWGLRDYNIPPSIWGGAVDCEHDWVEESIKTKVGRGNWAQATNGHGSCSICGAWRGCFGLEPTPEMYVDHAVSVFREVRRVLREDGTLWLNLGDCYNAHLGQRKTTDAAGPKQVTNEGAQGAPSRYVANLKPKDLVGIPWRVAFALQADGWWLRSDIIWCLSGGAWVYAHTQKGEMPVMVKDLVRLNPATVKLWNGTKWTQALGWSQADDDDSSLELVLRSGERIGCTRGHVWPTQRGNVAASDLRNGDILQSCILPEPSNCGRPAYLMDDLLWLIGLYLAEGNVSDDLVQLSLHTDEMCWLPRIESIAEHYGAGCTHTLDGNNLCVRLYSRVVAEIIAQYIGGIGAADKHLKVLCWSLPNESLRLITQGYLAGDGHVDPYYERIRLGFCRNYSLERDLRTLAARLGAVLTLAPITVTGFGRQFPAFRGEWRWARSGHRNEKDRGEIVEIRASRARKFWDIGVEDEPHLFALASGILTHNSKPAPMPESVTDRPTRSHEYIFLLSKSEQYYYDHEAIKEPAVCGHSSGNGYKRDARLSFQDERGARGSDEQWQPASWRGSRFDKGKTKEAVEQTGAKVGVRPSAPKGSFNGKTEAMADTGQNAFRAVTEMRNLRDVWTVGAEPFPEAHFATFPSKLIEPCVIGGCPEGGRILDPFFGAGTTGFVAGKHRRKFVGIELNSEYVAMAEKRMSQQVLFE